MNPFSKIADYIHEKKLIHRAINYTRNRIPFLHTQNYKYDLQTLELIKKYCNKNSNCIDIGCYKGDIMDWYLRYASNGKHFGFEPIPYLYTDLTKKYNSKECSLYNLALSDKAGVVEFNYVKSDPGYSGFQEREYRTNREIIEKIQVKTKKLDDIIPINISIEFIKIDVEGAEFLVLKGAKQLIKRCKPIIVFEFEKAAGGYYGTTPEKMYKFFDDIGFSISTMENYLNNESVLNLEMFCDQFENRYNYYFVAYPTLK